MDKPCIVAIDEFQRIADYLEKNVEAILRLHIQRMRNCEFVLAGSDRHILGQYINQEGQKNYQLNDYFLMLWIQKKYGKGYDL